MGLYYWCKGALSGMTSLRAEWICANLAKSFGLPIPHFEIMHVLYELAKESKIETAVQFVSPMNCYVFASKHIDNAVDLMEENAHSLKLENSLGSRILLFDALIHNADRSTVNSNILYNKNEIWIIDHNNAFCKNWNESAFLRDHILTDDYTKARDCDYAEFLSALKAPELAEIITKHWSEMPPEWIDALEGLTLDEITSTY